jgi:maleamate amidohydrolase
VSGDLWPLVDEHLSELRERFAGRGFGGRMGFGQHPAVLVVDLIKAFTDERCPLASNLDAEVAVTRAILDAARAAGAPCVLTSVTYDAALEEAGLWSAKIPSSTWLVEGGEWVDFDERLGRAESDMVLVKKYASCFFGTDLASRLVSRGVDTLIITGCTTSGCVRASAVDACSLGLHTIVVEDAVGDRAPLSHLVSLFDLDAKYADVVASSEVLGYLEDLRVAGGSAAGARGDADGRQGRHVRDSIRQTATP